MMKISKYNDGSKIPPLNGRFHLSIEEEFLNPSLTYTSYLPLLSSDIEV